MSFGVSTPIKIEQTNGAFLKETPTATEIMALDRENMEAVLRTVGIAFPESWRQRVLFDPTNYIILARRGGELIGYVDFLRDPKSPDDIYLSSIQIKAGYRQGTVAGQEILDSPFLMRLFNSTTPVK